MTNVVQLTSGERLALLQESYAAMGDEPDGRLLVGGQEATILWESTVECFMQGLWVPTILCAQATCERTLAGVVALRELPGYGITASPGWEQRWGLGRIIKHVREQGWVPSDVLDDVETLCEARKPWGHWRLPFDVGTIGRQVGDALEASGWDADAAEIRQQILGVEALRAATTTLRLYLGNYGMGPFDV